jgi:hypothetical protein
MDRKREHNSLMAHFAQLDENNTVIQVIVVSNNELLIDGVESEDKGILFCKSLFGNDTKWVQTSYNATFRKNYCGVGFTYDPVFDHFFAPKPYASWILNADAKWEAPTPMPTDEKRYNWNEENQTWDLNETLPE